MPLLPALLLSLAAQEPPWARSPLDYGERPVDDRVARLAARIEADEVELARDGRQGLLPALLAALEIPVESQTTVFSRTSFQARRITPTHPRALYFSDDVYVGYVPGSDVFELTAMDAREGPVFYTLTDSDRGPEFQRETHRCLQCHAPSRNDELPAHLVRSVHPRPDGMPLLRAGSRFVDHTTPLEERWGGWYVTGGTGALAHLGNQRLGEDQERLVPVAGEHATLAGLCDPGPYPVDTSDVVALLLLEHQTHVHDVLAWAGYEARRALHYQVELNEVLRVAPDTPVRSTEVRLEAAAEKVMRALLLVDEAPLPNPMGADSPFARVFEAAGRRDEQGRSLRDLDLQRRLFRRPLSYLIHSPSFAGLPEPLRERVWLKLWLVLNGVLEGPDEVRLARRDREAVLAVLAGTWAGDLPAYW